MTRFAFILFAIFLISPALQAARPPMITLPAMSKAGGSVEAIYMLNGDIISGKFVKFDPKTGLIWEAAGIKPALQIDPAGIDRVTFKGQAPAKAPQSRILLNSGNELTGKIEIVDADKVVINSWYAGRLEFKRTAIKAIIPARGGSEQVTFNGPKSEKDWVFSTAKNAGGKKGVLNNFIPPKAIPGNLPKKNVPGGMFQFKANSFESTGSGAMVGREVEFPDKSITEFDLDWKTPTGRSSAYFNLNVNFFSDNLKSGSNGNSYSLKLSQTGASLSRHEMQDGEPVSNRLGSNARVNLTGIGSRARFSFRVDRKKRTFILFINGQKICNWKDKGEFAGKGAGLVFTSRASYPVRISNISIKQWDGSLPVSFKDTLGSPKEDFLRLANDDTMSGSVISIRENIIHLKTISFGDVNVPLNRTGLIQFAGNNAPINEKLPKGVVTAKLKGYGSLTFSLKSWKDGKLEVESPDFGTATIDGSIVESITFNQNKKRASGDNGTLSKKELKKQLRDKEKGNIAPVPQRFPRPNK
jgi:hypothetical protein